MTDAVLEALIRVEEALNSRWPETKIEPSLTRVERAVTLLGDPHLAYPVIHVTGTNGKTSTVRMIERLLRELGMNTGLITSPHLHSVTERIRLNGEPITAERFVRIYDEIEPIIAIADVESMAEGGPALSYFEVLTVLGFAVFADAPVDIAVIEVGMGGTWDATNVVQPAVAVVTPIGIDHADYLGETITEIAREKSGIIKPGVPTILAAQVAPAAEVLLERVAEVGAPVARAGLDFGVRDRRLAVGGQVLTLQGIDGEYADVLLNLHGAHQAENAATALAAVEAFFGGKAVNPDAVHRAFAAVTSPGRLEVVRRSPTVLVDAAHNPHGAAVLAQALDDSFTFSAVVGVVSVMADKDVAGLLTALEPVLNEIVCTWNGSPRAMAADELAELAASIFGAERVHVAPRVAAAIELAVARADDLAPTGAGVVVTGSVVTAAVGRAVAGHIET